MQQQHQYEIQQMKSELEEQHEKVLDCVVTRLYISILMPYEHCRID